MSWRRNMKIVRVVAVLIVVEFPYEVPPAALEIEAPGKYKMDFVN